MMTNNALNTVRPSLGVYLGSILFWMGFGLSTMIFSTFGWLILWPLDFRGRYRVMSQWSRFNIWWLKRCCGLDCEVSGLEHLPREGAAIVMAKHQSTWETLAIQRFIPPQVWVLKRELMRIPFFGWGMAIMHPIAIDRKAGKKSIDQLIAQGTDRLQRGLWVVIFPEGTRMPVGQQGRYKSGGAMLAVNTQSPIIPVAHNSGQYWPRRGFLIYPGKISMEFGPAIDPSGQTAEAVLEKTRAWIETRMQVLETPAPAMPTSDDRAKP